ncbi:hypothetical protein ParaKuw1_00020 [Paracoccus phage ParKuw1]|uniref:Uncharacterized protein n=1 Tax=Paracoccus phage ParKuw1 TaxID=3032415 RepID=A0AAF0FKW9_9CAUD|nr:hypothetical protein ParaKuw1_00020 [Paracoccus phage ParKuw1]
MASISFTKLASVNDEASIANAIKSLHTRGDSLQLDIHRLLVAICTRWAASGDVRPVAGHINMLLAKDKLGGVRKNAIRAWVETYMGLKLVEEGENKGNFYAPKAIANGQHLDMKALTNNRWWEFKPEAEYKPIDDPRKLIAGLVAKMEKDVAQMGEASKVTPEMIAALKAARTPEVLH